MKKIVFIKNFIDAYGGKTTDFVMSPERKQRADILFSAQERQRFVTAEKITADLIEQCFDIHDFEICGVVSQKPYIKNYRNICFSRSYCNDSLCVAVEDAERIGVDCEVIKNADDLVIKYFFTDSEKTLVENSPDKDVAFSLVWTRKESYIKCIGEGLGFRLDLLDVAPKPHTSIQRPLLIKNNEIGDLYINSYVIDDAVVSVCSEKEDAFPMCIEDWSYNEKNNY